MLWSQRLVQDITEPQIINDSKTPSGSVHLGSLRGVLIHDAIRRSLNHKGVDAKFLYGLDDFDPLDGLPENAPEYLHDYMGVPLCRIPSPQGSKEKDLATHYGSAFIDLLPSLGVKADIYRMRDVYTSGKFNQVIDALLSNGDKVREILLSFGGKKRADWMPFQVVCESCGKIATTRVIAYSNQKVEYKCEKNQVNWAKGCGYHGSTSPFDGGGKLPWKIEWAAKWYVFNVTIEGAGKDHCTKGGSRDVAQKCMREILRKRPPLNVPYEFFLVEGAKMSSSKGVGVSVQTMFECLPVNVLRYLMLKSHPKQTVNFSPSLETFSRLFNAYDQLSTAEDEDSCEIMKLSAYDGKKPIGRSIDFSLLVALAQFPHIDVEKEIEKRSKHAFNSDDRLVLKDRLATVKFWLQHWSKKEEQLSLQKSPPASVTNLSLPQLAFLHDLAEYLDDNLSADQCQRLIFARARMTPIGPKDAFIAIYTVLFDKKNGPKAGAILAHLEKEYLYRMFTKVVFSKNEFLCKFNQM